MIGINRDLSDCWSKLLGNEPLSHNIKIKIRRCQDQISNTKFLKWIPTGRTTFNHEFTQRGSHDIGASAMSYDMNTLDLWNINKKPQKLFEMKNRELSGFTIDEIAEEPTAGRWPTVKHGDAPAADKMP